MNRAGLIRNGCYAVLASVLVAAGLAACGSSSAPPAKAKTTATAPITNPTTTTTTASGPFNSCSVVTQAEAASALGASVTAGVLGNATVEGGKACVFYGATAPAPRDANVAEADSVRVVVVEGGDAVTWYDAYKATVSPQAISGYGDQAYYDGVASLSVLKGDVYVRIAVVPAAAAPSLSAEEKLAKAILPNV
jgi:hypothetical protein